MAEYQGVVEQRKEWYLRRSCPIFCKPCQGIYEAVYPSRRAVLLFGTALWIVGFVIILAAFLICIAGACSAVAASLCPVGIFLMFLGYGLFHCGWAAYLLDEPSILDTNHPVDWESPRGTTPPRQPAAPFETAYDTDQPKSANAGFWQFIDQEAWQTVATRDTLQ